MWGVNFYHNPEDCPLDALPQLRVWKFNKLVLKLAVIYLQVICLQCVVVGTKPHGGDQCRKCKNAVTYFFGLLTMMMRSTGG